MQDRYVGDLGDFGKYGLLRALCQSDRSVNTVRLTLGVVWYLVADEGHNADGMHIGYLDDTPKSRARFRDCDPILYDALRHIVVRDKMRSVNCIREHKVLPADTLFHEELLHSENRVRWLKSALGATAHCSLVFVDPDNGLESKAGPQRHHKFGPKYAFFDEMQRFLLREQSLVIYQHLGRNDTADNQIRMRLAELDDRLNSHATSFAMRYHRGTSRAFLIVPKEGHTAMLRQRAEALTQGANAWSRKGHSTSVAPANSETLS